MLGPGVGSKSGEPAHHAIPEGRSRGGSRGLRGLVGWRCRASRPGSAPGACRWHHQSDCSSSRRLGQRHSRRQLPCRPQNPGSPCLPGIGCRRDRLAAWMSLQESDVGATGWRPGCHCGRRQPAGPAGCRRRKCRREQQMRQPCDAPSRRFSSLSAGADSDSGRRSIVDVAGRWVRWTELRLSPRPRRCVPRRSGRAGGFGGKRARCRSRPRAMSSRSRVRTPFVRRRHRMVGCPKGVLADAVFEVVLHRVLSGDLMVRVRFGGRKVPLLQSRGG